MDLERTEINHFFILRTYSILGPVPTHSTKGAHGSIYVGIPNTETFSW